jgi:hypothetical protein
MENSRIKYEAVKTVRPQLRHGGCNFLHKYLKISNMCQATKPICQSGNKEKDSSMFNFFNYSYFIQESMNIAIYTAIALC